MEEKVNTTYLCLIPKNSNATHLKNFRPIGICNTQYKIITKIIANRTKSYLANLISPTQASFLSNRRAAENAIITQEYITHFSKIRGKQDNVILKIDLEKAPYRIELSFIRQAPRFLNFPPKLTTLIMSCISTSSIPILVNRGKNNFFIPTRGITQGVPISPTFLLYTWSSCLEG